MKPLANTLGGVLRDAINDAKEFSAAGHKLDMSVYLDLPHEGRSYCQGCLAGATMVCRLDAVERHLESAGGCVEYLKLYAIDSLRLGEISEAMHNLNIKGPVPINLQRGSQIISKVRNFARQPWLEDWSAHLALADELDKHNL